jgi:hypothetical protein
LNLAVVVVAKLARSLLIVQPQTVLRWRRYG